MERSLTKETPSLVGTTVKLQGWVENLRILSKVSFLDLRDRSGKVQCIAEFKLEDLTIESVVEIEGEVIKRPEKMVKEGSETGTVEIQIKSYKVLNKAAALPIPVAGDGYDINEESRLKYRYLDLRRDRLSKNLKLRSDFVRAVRESLYNQGFVEVETPMLTAPTKEGARDFIVPSRMQPGKFYALPQSPQQYKQLLMAAGVENYFQVARCVRDENLRADRGFEHTQIDVETSFRTQEEVRAVMEKMVKESIKAVKGNIKPGDFPVLTYKEVIEKFGDDKFDIRTEEEKEKGILAFAWVTRYPMFKKVDKEDIAEVRDGKSGWTFTHNPFSGTIAEHKEWHLKGEHLDEIEATQYDLVCNGFEMGSGSVRNHDPELLRATYKIMGYSPEETEASIGHMLKAFELGTPPHGGMALGIDRLVMLLAGEKSLKEVIPFPMTYSGNTSVMDAPIEAKPEQLKDLGIKVEK
ncbi:MAG: amino acid--tRNA ligase-related protein [Candidatus Dojkabacteria bacterium]